MFSESRKIIALRIVSVTFLKIFERVESMKRS